MRNEITTATQVSQVSELVVQVLYYALITTTVNKISPDLASARTGLARAG